MSAARLSRSERTVEFDLRRSTVADMPLASENGACWIPTTFNVTPTRLLT